MRRVILVLLVSFALLTTSCGLRTQVNPDAFGAKKKYAVVSVETLRPAMENLGKGKAGFDASEVFENTKTIVLAKLLKSPHFRLMPEGGVLRNTKYRDYPDGDIAKTTGADFMAAKGYKLSSDLKNKKWYARLARDLNVDGTMVISMSFSTMPAPSGDWELVITTLALYAFDRDGNVVASIVESNGGRYVKATRDILLGRMLEFTREPLIKETLLSTNDAAEKLVGKLDRALMNQKAKQK